MAIIGISVQSNTGIPLMLDAWSDKLAAFRGEGTPILICGFLSALSSFAKSYRQNIDYIRLNPVDFNDPYGIDGVYSFIGEYMVLCFTDPYQFHKMVNLKIQWIYSKVLIKYEQMIRTGRVPTLTEEEHLFIEKILMDNVPLEIITRKKEQLRVAVDYIKETEFPGDIYGCAITSFDNTILFTHGMERIEVETYLNGVGTKEALHDGEILHNYVAFPGLEPRLVVMTNPGVKIQIADIIEEPGEGSVPLYYYLITDANCSIGPIVESLMQKFNAVLL
jgi:hypothetical protein